MANNANDPANVKPRSRLSRILAPFGGILVIAAVWFGGGAVGEFLQPWRYAGAQTCIETDYNLGAYRNTCDHDIVLGWCADGPPADGKACTVEPLAPLAISASWISALPGGQGAPRLATRLRGPLSPGLDQ